MRLFIPQISQGNELVTAYVYLKRGLIPKDAAIHIDARTKSLADNLSTKNIIKVRLT